MGPTTPRSTVLSAEEEATVVAFRRHTLLPLDDCLYALQPAIPHLTRSSLHRCLERHGINRLPEIGGDRPQRKAFKDYPGSWAIRPGYVHIDFAEVRTEGGKLYLFVAIDRTSKAVYTELHEDSQRATAVGFLHAVVAAFPYRIHTVLTGGRSPAHNGVQFANRAQDRWNGRHFFGRACDRLGIEHRLTKVGHPWTNGQVERMNRTPPHHGGVEGGDGQSVPLRLARRAT